jgi:hypothetical protein
MADSERLKTWETLFQRALLLIDDARSHDIPVDEWTFGGGTVLMRRHLHRFSKDVDIFINDPQFIGFLSPRLSHVAESLKGSHTRSTKSYLSCGIDERSCSSASAPMPQCYGRVSNRSKYLNTGATLMSVSR